MRVLIGSLLILLFVVNPVFGQLTEIRVDNSTMPGEDIAEVVINPLGEIVITSRTGIEYEIKEKVVIPGAVVINSFTINNSLTANLSVGASATLRWNTSNATQCSASTNPANQLSGWNTGTVIDVAGPVTVVFPTAGIYNIFLDCIGDSGTPQKATVTAQVGSATITKFTVTPNAAVTGTNVDLTLEWASSNTSLGCAGSLNWPNSTALASSGTQNITVNDIQPGTQYTLTCFGAFDEDNATVSIAVTDPQVSCNSTLTAKIESDWSQVFREAWPGPKSEQVRETIPTKGYFAIKFSTGSAQDSGFFTNIEASGTSGYRLGAISKCPGDFDVPDTCTHKWGDAGGIFWSTVGGAGKCNLDPNSTYYWNMTFTDGVSPNSSRCIGTFCETYFVVSNR